MAINLRGTAPDGVLKTAQALGDATVATSALPDECSGCSPSTASVQEFMRDHYYCCVHRLGSMSMWGSWVLYLGGPHPRWYCLVCMLRLQCYKSDRPEVHTDAKHEISHTVLGTAVVTLNLSPWLLATHSVLPQERNLLTRCKYGSSCRCV